MLRRSDIEVDNWFLYKPDGYYCTLQAKRDFLTVEGFQNTVQCSVHDLAPIKISTHILSVCGFKPSAGIYTKISHSGMTVFFRFDHDGEHEVWCSDEQIFAVTFLHQLQNSYFKMTGEALSPNLYGVKE
jgi:hypothetical protein